MQILICALITVISNRASRLACPCSCVAYTDQADVLYLLLMVVAASLGQDATDSIGDCPGLKTKTKKPLKFNVIFSRFTVLLRIIFSVV